MRVLVRFFFLCLPLVTDGAFVLTIPTSGEHCFVISTPPGPERSTIIGSFELLDTTISPRPLSVVLLNDKLEHVYQSTPKARNEHFSIETMGRVSMCVRNGMHPAERDKFARTVGLDITVKTAAANTQSAMNQYVNELSDQLHQLFVDQVYLKARESHHRELTESTFTKLVLYTLLEFVCVVLASLAQIWYLRRFVEKRRY